MAARDAEAASACEVTSGRRSAGGLTVDAQLLQFLPGDNFAMHLVGTVGEAQRAGIRPSCGPLEVLRDPATAVNLDRTVQDANGEVRGNDLDHRDFRARGLV